MNLTYMTRILRHTSLAMAFTLPMTLAPVLANIGNAQTPKSQRAPSVISSIEHQVDNEITRVILHADTPIDYRGGALHGSQVVLDLCNVKLSLPGTVVELGAPEVDRVIVGPEITRDGERVLKLRLTGVKASSHRVVAKGNELHVELTALRGARDGHKGLPKIINNKMEVTAENNNGGDAAPAIQWAKATPVPVGQIEFAASGDPEPRTEALLEAVVIPDPVAGDDPAPEPQPVEVALAAPIAMPVPVATPSAVAIPAPVILPAAAPEQARVLTVAVGRSITLESEVPVTRVSVSNPLVAEPLAISPTQFLINGLVPGSVSLVLWPKQGVPIVYDLVVKIDTTALAQQIETIFPGERVSVQASKDSIVLSGKTTNPAVAEKIVNLASDYSSKVVNYMNTAPTSRRQVMLKVKFAEVNKSAMTELSSVLHHVNPVAPSGSDRGTAGTGTFTPPGGNLLNNPIGPDLTWTDAINLSFFEKSIDLGIFITALKSRGLFQELAEPTLIAADGQEASFLAGGEFPVPVAQPGANFVSVTIEWKKFGISLDFKPTISREGIITLKVKPEVSALDFASGVLLNGFRIPTVIVRRTETEIELRSGQSFAIAGLYDKTLLQSKSKIPVLGDIPLLGYLFRSKGLQKNQTELLVIVTPILVEPLSVDAPTPDLTYPESFELDKPAKK